MRNAGCGCIFADVGGIIINIDEIFKKRMIFFGCGWNFSKTNDIKRGDNTRYMKDGSGIKKEIVFFCPEIRNLHG